MTPIRLMRLAWAGAITAVAFSFLYLIYAPVSASAVDAGLTIGAALVGAVTGAVVESGVERRITSRRSQATVIRLPSEAQPLERLTAKGA